MGQGEHRGYRDRERERDREIEIDDQSATKGPEPVVPGALVGQGEHRGYGLCPQQRPRQRCHSGKHFIHKHLLHIIFYCSLFDILCTIVQM